MTSALLLLTVWSAAASVWWIIGGRAVFREPIRPRPKPASLSRTSLTLFKALPPSESTESREVLAEAVRSFVDQLGAGMEMILGVPNAERAFWDQRLAEWQTVCPAARLVPVPRPRVERHANPKIAVLEVLAREARGDLWLWSDADVLAPPGLVADLLSEMTNDAGAVTCAYCIRHVERSSAVLDALFVNLEFLPGALFLGRRGRINFAFGAAILFRVTDFRERFTWDELGAVLADDYLLGKRLGGVRLSRHLVETLPVRDAGWWRAIQHYYRWHKTIRWCRPGGYAGLAAVMPLLGWGTAVVSAPGQLWFWAGLGGQWALELLGASVLLHRLGCRLPVAAWGGVFIWPAWRVINWIGSWVPIPVVWGEGRGRWRGPKVR